MKKLIIILIFFFSQINFGIANTDIVFVDMDIIMNKSKAGVSILNQLKKKNDLISKNFKNDEKKVAQFFDSIKDSFLARYNENVTLLTIRHYSEDVIDNMTKDKQIYLEQKTRNTARFILK